jgi:hypothetical protein
VGLRLLLMATNNSDSAVELAISANAPLVLVPCCHTVHKKWEPHALAGPNALEVAKAAVAMGTVGVAGSVDAARMRALRAAKFRVKDAHGGFSIFSSFLFFNADSFFFYLFFV